MDAQQRGVACKSLALQEKARQNKNKKKHKQAANGEALDSSRGRSNSRARAVTDNEQDKGGKYSSWCDSPWTCTASLKLCFRGAQ